VPASGRTEPRQGVPAPLPHPRRQDKGGSQLDGPQARGRQVAAGPFLETRRQQVVGGQQTTRHQDRPRERTVTKASMAFWDAGRVRLLGDRLDQHRRARPAPLETPLRIFAVISQGPRVRADRVRSGNATRAPERTGRCVYQHVAAGTPGPRTRSSRQLPPVQQGARKIARLPSPAGVVAHFLGAAGPWENLNRVEFPQKTTPNPRRHAGGQIRPQGYPGVTLEELGAGQHNGHPWVLRKRLGLTTARLRKRYPAGHRGRTPIMVYPSARPRAGRAFPASKPGARSHQDATAPSLSSRAGPLSNVGGPPGLIPGNQKVAHGTDGKILNLHPCDWPPTRYFTGAVVDYSFGFRGSVEHRERRKGDCRRGWMERPIAVKVAGTDLHPHPSATPRPQRRWLQPQSVGLLQP